MLQFDFSFFFGLLWGFGAFIRNLTFKPGKGTISTQEQLKFTSVGSFGGGLKRD